MKGLWKKSGLSIDNTLPTDKPSVNTFLYKKQKNDECRQQESDNTNQNKRVLQIRNTKFCMKKLEKAGTRYFTCKWKYSKIQDVHTVISLQII